MPTNDVTFNIGSEGLLWVMLVSVIHDPRHGVSHEMGPLIDASTTPRMRQSRRCPTCHIRRKGSKGMQAGRW